MKTECARFNSKFEPKKKFCFHLSLKSSPHSAHFLAAFILLWIHFLNSVPRSICTHIYHSKSGCFIFDDFSSFHFQFVMSLNTSAYRPGAIQKFYPNFNRINQRPPPSSPPCQSQTMGTSKTQWTSISSRALNSFRFPIRRFLSLEVRTIE